MFKNNWIFCSSLVILFFMIISFSALAQRDCPDEDPCPDSTWTTGVTWSDFLGTDGNYMEYSGTFSWRECPPGSYQIKDFEVSALTSDMWNEGDHNEEHYEGLLEFAEINSLNKLINILGGFTNIPTCPAPGTPFATIYSAACGVWLRCSYEFDCDPGVHTITKHKDGEGQSTYTCPDPYTYNGNPTIDVWRWESCGDVCCEKTYTVCKVTIIVPGGPNYDQIVIQNVDRHKLTDSECTNEGDFVKWEDGTTVIPCDDGCEGDGY